MLIFLVVIFVGSHMKNLLMSHCNTCEVGYKMVVHLGLTYMDNAQVRYKKDVGNMIDNCFDYLQMAQQNQNHQMVVLNLTRKNHPM